MNCTHCNDTGYEPNDTGESAFDGDPCVACRPDPPMALGALIPPELAWQEGQTAGYIASVNLLLQIQSELKIKTPNILANLIQEIDNHLQWLGVRK
jgi:hypothetical protein